MVSKNESSMSIEFLPNDKDFKNPPKLTWLANIAERIIEVDYVEFGDLLTVKKVEEEMKFEDIVNRDSKKEGKFIADIQVKELA